MPYNTRILLDSGLLYRIGRLAGFKYERGAFDFSIGFGVADEVLRRAKAQGKRLLFVGGTSDEAERFEGILRGRYGFSANELAVRQGHVTDHEAYCVSLIGALKPEIVVLSLGAPLQERCAVRVAQAAPRLDVFTCGGFITQTAGASGDFYPRLVQVLGLRWLYRFVTQPGVLKRTLHEYPAGIIEFMRQRP